MSKDQGKEKTEAKQIPATKEKQKIKSAELSDAELDKVAGGMVSLVQTAGTPLRVSEAEERAANGGGGGTGGYGGRIP
jgi:hypothetical protein